MQICTALKDYFSAVDILDGTTGSSGRIKISRTSKILSLYLTQEKRKDKE